MIYRARLNEAADHLKSLGYHPIFVSLYGSQNYGLDLYTEEYESDFDYKTVILPNLWDLVADSKPVSTVIDYEGGQVDVKDIRAFTETLIKMNPAYLETLFTPYFITLNEGDKWYAGVKGFVPRLLEERGLLFTKACCGMFYEKEKAMCHPYPATKDKIEKYGYDGKQAHHMKRLILMLQDFSKTGTMVLMPPEMSKQLLMALKINEVPFEMVKYFVDNIWKQTLDQIRIGLENKYKEVRSDAANEIIVHSCEAVYAFCLSDDGKGKK